MGLFDAAVLALMYFESVEQQELDATRNGSERETPPLTSGSNVQS